jgi:hypothetical protein
MFAILGQGKGGIASLGLDLTKGELIVVKTIKGTDHEVIL